MMVNSKFWLCVGVRDYIHVLDLAVGHVAALRKLDENCGCKVSSNNNHFP